jgi:hypothetical protein
MLKETPNNGSRLFFLNFHPLGSHLMYFWHPAPLQLDTGKTASGSGKINFK